MKDTFGHYIRKLRKQHKLTLTQLAAKLDLDSANLSKIENGKRRFDEKRLELLADCFDLDLKELKEEYFSEVFAKKLYETNCSSKALALAEEKVKYLKSKNAKQVELL
jgi:HTH-type transcriptional regulator, competence development regulator